MQGSLHFTCHLSIWEGGWSQGKIIKTELIDTVCFLSRLILLFYVIGCDDSANVKTFRGPCAHTEEIFGSGCGGSLTKPLYRECEKNTHENSITLLVGLSK